MNYESCLDFLLGQLPMFQQQGKKALKYDLSNIVGLCALLNNPQKNFKSIHIAGTNGKGSVSHQIASILQSAGYKIGLYTSPHLVDFRERIRINGQLIEKEFVTQFVANGLEQFKSINPTFFELTTAMAFAYFASEKVDFAVIETGLGGRLDSTNIILPLLSIITNISYDHTDILGDTLEKIAFEKAGIIKPNIPVVIGERNDSTLPVFTSKALQEHAPIVFADSKYTANILNENFDSFEFEIIERTNQNFVFKGVSDLIGRYQLKNIVTSYCALEILRDLGYAISDVNLYEGYKNVKQRTGLMGRWQVVQKDPLIICDTAHNPSGIEQIAQQLSMLKPRRIHIVLGFSADKNYQLMLKMLAEIVGNKGISYYFTRSSVSRSLDPIEIARVATGFSIEGEVYSEVSSAFESAKQYASSEDVIFIGGSNFVVGDFLKYYIVK
ncbi:MAG: bifunctional folylpolyglutamate synthase/dihydrofolate synthase [Bacteroidales bacterium]|nr:bifunctional folylpolyglutamate synthase/dihydrofolate synthase [Bacteroidales bacterium]